MRRVTYSEIVVWPEKNTDSTIMESRQFEHKQSDGAHMIHVGDTYRKK